MKAAVSKMKEAKFDHTNMVIARVDIPVTTNIEISSDSSFTAKSGLRDKNVHSEMHGEAKTLK